MFLLRPLPLSPKPVVALSVFAVLWLVVAAVSGTGVRWPDPFRSQAAAAEQQQGDLDPEALDRALAGLETAARASAVPQPRKAMPQEAGEARPATPGRADAGAPAVPGSGGGLLAWLEGAGAGAARGAGAAAGGRAAEGGEPPVLAVEGVPEGIPAIEDNCAEGSAAACKRKAMAPFYAALAGVSRGRQARVLIYGDSLIMGDLVTGQIRELLQRQFGNAGPGLVYPVRPCKWYGIEGVATENDRGWKIYRVTSPHLEDGMYGLGGQAFVAPGGGLSASLRCAAECPWTDVTDYAVYYLAGPGGGKFKVSVAGGSAVEVDTRADASMGAVRVLTQAAGEPDLALESVSGKVRLFGVAVENRKPGVVVDAAAILGARAYRLNNEDPVHFEQQLALRRPDLVVLMFGANESEVENVARDAYKEDLRQLLTTLRAGLPGASILMVSPPARGEVKDGHILVKRAVKQLVAVQREACAESGVAYWSLFDAMGADKGALRWYRHEPALLNSDLTHLTRAGATLLGKMLYAVMLSDYVAWKKQ